MVKQFCKKNIIITNINLLYPRYDRIIASGVLIRM